ncbi:hypothetical protein [Stenotrophomonas sp. SORGH_AS_0282]|uniref:hypothetical protein n=1 Tax=Stenotrophomonas sp. SORGH_AS_0282 TaxID=3041763 RepID=UPI002781DEE9|nr:hypothetical protein [Stenotrophomonas sp. SORGH_AS_0282]MDQ1062370.1 hypothetical protein [Stenotrophomonas sp. SORGH_AS_0282]MDQ1189273.1 hypothetical protein [Stenotrophomonas sp. SORGH_AS_0282]
MSAPWDKNPVSPEAKSLVDRDRAARNLEKSMPRRWWHDIVFGWAGLLIIAGLAVALIATIFGMWGAFR